MLVDAGGVPTLMSHSMGRSSSVSMRRDSTGGIVVGGVCVCKCETSPAVASMGAACLMSREWVRHAHHTGWACMRYNTGEGDEGRLGLKERDAVPVVRAEEVIVAIELGDGGHVVVGEGKVEDGEVLGNAGRSNALGDNRGSALHCPAQSNLGHRLAVLGGDGGQHRVGENGGLVGALKVSRAERRVAGDNNVLALAVANESLLLEIRVELHLGGGNWG
jgi:hypothetical protein